MTTVTAWPTMTAATTAMNTPKGTTSKTHRSTVVASTRPPTVAMTRRCRGLIAGCAGGAMSGLLLRGRLLGGGLAGGRLAGGRLLGRRLGALLGEELVGALGRDGLDVVVLAERRVGR